MGKYYGKIGYAVTTEKVIQNENSSSVIHTGIWESTITEKMYSGDVVEDYSSRRDNAGKVNDNMRISNTISILADPFAFDNFSNIVYVEFMNALWKVSECKVRFPRLLLTLGGVYNGEQASPAPNAN